MVRLFLVAMSCAIGMSASTASAGFGWLHGGGSSGGYAAYGSSGGGYGAASYGSSGGYSAYSYGSSGSYVGGSSGSYVGGSSGYDAYGSSGGGHGPGPLRRLAAHIHDHMAAKHARHAGYGSSGYGSSGGSSGYSTSYGSSGYSTSYGSSGYSTSYGSSGYSTSYGSSGYSTSYGSSGSSSSYGSAGSMSYSSGYLGVSKASPVSAASFASLNTSSTDDAIYLNVSVPASAKVYVNNMATTSTGASRQFVSRGLQAGKQYKFDVRAELIDAQGKLVDETKTVTLTAGAREDLRFASLTSARVETVVTLNVPQDAKVVLAGNETSATGSTRTFRTSQLKAGDQWDDYIVEVHHDGKIKRETLRLVAGDDIALSFNFSDDTSLVASR